MTHRTQNAAGKEHDEHHDQLDRTLDAALAKYATVEPRSGLEDRVLANLRANMAQAPSNAGWRRWQWTAAAVAAGIVVAMFAWRSGKSYHPAIANRPSITTPAMPTANGEKTQTKMALNDSGESTHVRGHSAAAELPHRLTPVIVAAAPKLDVFPSPQPLSEQEKILANYVAQFHDQAVLIARARAEELQKDLAEDAREAGKNQTDLEPVTN